MAHSLWENNRSVPSVPLCGSMMLSQPSGERASGPRASVPVVNPAAFPNAAAGAGVRPMRRSYPLGNFVFQDGAQDLQPSLPGQLLDPSLHSPPTPRPSATAPAPATLAFRPSQTCDWTSGLSSGNSFSRRLSPLKRDSQPEL